jgi:hypothetical protein
MKMGRAAMWVSLRNCGLTSLLLLLAAACGQTGTTESGETHFLLTCSSETCAEGFECLCGACSRRCHDDAACSDLGASVTCVEHDTNQCKTVTKACDAGCGRDADCQSLGAQYACAAGFCRVDPTNPEPEPQADVACTSGCGDSECGTPGACSLETACSLVDCGGVTFDEDACVRPSCESDGACADDQRCTSVLLSRHYDCTESADACSCTAGLGLFPLQICSPVTLAGPRGTWTSIEVESFDRFIETRWTIHPDGGLDKVVMNIENQTPTQPASTAQVSVDDLDELNRMIDGAQLRSALVDPTPCAVVNDGGVSVRLTLDSRTLEKVVTGCLNSDPQTQPFPELFDLVNRY